VANYTNTKHVTATAGNRQEEYLFALLVLKYVKLSAEMIP
jgi:hypothetical protein